MKECVRFGQIQPNFIQNLFWICPKMNQNHVWGSYFIWMDPKKLLKLYKKCLKISVSHFSTRFPFQHRVLHIHLNLCHFLLWQEMCKRCWNWKTNSLIANKLDGVSLTTLFRNSNKRFNYLVPEKEKKSLSLFWDPF